MFNLFFYKNKNIIVFFILMTLSIASIAFRSMRAKDLLSEVYNFVTLPFAELLTGTTNTISSLWNNLLYYNERLEKMKLLEKELEKKQASFENVELLQQEINRLKKMIDYKAVIPKLVPSSVESIAADIVMRSPNNYFPTFIINKGRHHGIKKSMPVIAFQLLRREGHPETLEQVVVGKIDQVTELAARILPITDPDCIIHVKLKSPLYSEYTGFIKGFGSYSQGLSLTNVDKSIDLVGEETLINEELVTSGEQSIFPRGIKVGFIKEDLSDESSNEKRFRVTPHVEYSRLSSVFVLKKELPKQLMKLIESMR
ncbi:MAG TPA: rod shape-determining protein MreC [Spirochaetes bacterium]|nr:rod shape-determining protein MreC [Spirochaetota bacterium]